MDIKEEAFKAIISTMESLGNEHPDSYQYFDLMFVYVRAACVVNENENHSMFPQNL